MKINLVKMDDTHFCDESFLHHFGIFKLFSVYVYTPDECTYCCELTPSYCLYFVHTQAEYRDDLTDEQREEMWESLNEVDCDMPQTTYMHCRTLDANKNVVDLGDFDSVEEAVEYCQANWQ